MKRKLILAWAVLCGNGRLHSIRKSRSRAELRAALADLKDDACGPHRVSGLSLPMRGLHKSEER
jgi:hypothetical protein